MTAAEGSATRRVSEGGFLRGFILAYASGYQNKKATRAEILVKDEDWDQTEPLNRVESRTENRSILLMP